MNPQKKDQFERVIAVIGIVLDLLPRLGLGLGLGLDHSLDRTHTQSLILILGDTRIVIITTIFLFVAVNMNFLARSLYRGLSIRPSALCAANVRWFSDMTEEKRVCLGTESNG